MSLASLCSKHLVEKRVKTRATGTAGSASFTWPSTGTWLRCYVQSISTREQVVLLQRGYEVSHRIYFASDPGVENGDHLLLDGRTLEVVGKPVNACEASRFWKVEALEQEQSQ